MSIIIKKIKNTIFFMIYAALIIVSAYVTAMNNYLLFHTLIEIASIFILWGIFVMSVNSYETSENSYLMFIAIGFWFTGGWDLLHTLSYKGMHILSYTSTNTATQYWIVARVMMTITILISYRFLNKKIKVKLIALIYSLISSILFISIYYLKLFPICFIDGHGLTMFKKIMEYIICLITVFNINLLHKHKGEFNEELYKDLLKAFMISIFAELVFTGYGKPDEGLNAIGHILKIFSQYYMFRVFIQSSFIDPYKLLFRRMERTNINLIKRKLELEELNKSLSESEERYTQLIDRLPCGIIEYKDNVIANINYSAMKILNIRYKKEIIGKSITKLFNEDLNNDLIDGEGKETTIRCQNGKLINVSIGLAEFTFKNELINLLIFLDITQVKQNELLKAEIMQKEKEENLQNEFFSNLSHEFRTPLNILFNSVQMLETFNKNNIDNKNKEKIQKYLKIMRQNCNRLIRMSNNMIDITRVGSKFYNINRCKCNIIDVVEKIVLSTSTYIQNKGMILEFYKTIDKKIICCDIDMIERIVLNLISNAIKFSKGNGKIVVWICDDGGYTEIHVKDNGIGIPKEKVNDIFKRFKQVDNSFTRNNEGSGIGLSLVKAFVEMHGGSIDVISEEEKGSEFIVKLPDNDSNENCKDEKIVDVKENVERVNIEFSDIYF